MPGTGRTSSDTGPIERGPVEVAALVVESLPGGLFRVQLLTGAQELTAHLGGDSNLLRVRPGEGVVVEVSPLDPGRGRIVRRRP